MSSLKIASFEAENTSLKAQISSLQENNGNLDAKIITLKEKLKSVQEENSSLVETNDTLVNRISKLVDLYEPTGKTDETPQKSHEKKPKQEEIKQSTAGGSTETFEDDTSFHSTDTPKSSWFAPITQLLTKAQTSSNMVFNSNVIQQSDDNNNSSVIQSTRAKHYRAPIFKGITDGDETKPYLWILDFEKCIRYHGWNEAQSLDEFMMAMQGPASLWYNTLSAADKSTYASLMNKFQGHFGGIESIKSYALRAINDKKQGNESMISYGPKLITTICSITNEPELQLYFFGQMVNSETAALVNQKEPATLQEAVDYAVRMERKSKERNSIGGGVVNMGKPGQQQPQGGSALDNTIGAWAQNNDTSNQPTPMEDVQMNPQRFKKKFYPQNTGNDSSKSKSKCFACGKPGHLAKECRLLKKFKEKNAGEYKDNKKRRGGNNNHNVQQVKDKDNYMDKEVDFTKNPFNQIFKHNDMIKVTDISVSESSDPRSFTLPVKINNNNPSYDALVDTGAMVSTIRLNVVNDLQLQQKSTHEIIIVYGNNYEGKSDTEVVLDAELPQGAFKVTGRVVNVQNLDVILGMDWLLENDLIVDCKRKQLIPRSMLGMNQKEIVSGQGDITQSQVKEIKSPIQEELLQYGGFDGVKIMNLACQDLPGDTPNEVIQILFSYPRLTGSSTVQPIKNAPITHRINTGDAQPVVARGRRLSPKESRILMEEVEQMLARGVIRKSSSPWCSPPVIVTKKNGGVRFCTNYRKLNSITEKDNFPLPRMDDLIDSLKGATYFSLIDLKSAYWHIPIEEKDKCKTAFQAGGQLFEYNVLPFGLCNSPPTWCRFMQQIMQPVSSFCIVYLDDILCFGKSREENVQQVKMVMEILDKWNLKISLQKCHFLKEEVKFLGFIVSGTGVKSDPEKVSVIKNWEEPKDIQELQRFLGICTFYSKFLYNLAYKASPLYKLLKKDAEWNWGEAEQNAFDELKRMLARLPELAYPNPNLAYDLHCDASSYAMGAVLVQQGRPVAFASRTLLPAQLNYSVTEKECLCVAWALKHFHCYLHGSKVTVFTDHAALKSLLSTKDPKGRIARLILDIWSYEIKVVHRKGSENKDADALSRLRVNQLNSKLVKEPIRLKLIEQYQKEDDEILEIIYSPLVYPYFLCKNVLCYGKGNPSVVVIPKQLRWKFMEAIHDHPTGGHMGREKMFARASSNGWWQGMRQDIQEYLKTCALCQFHKQPTHKYQELKSIEVSRPGELWAADIAFLPCSKRGNRYLLVCMEYLTRWVVAVVLPQFDRNMVANVFLYSVVLQFGRPEKFLTDNGSNFISEAMKTLCARLGIKKIETSVEHPQSDGLVERMNKTIKTALQVYVENQEDVWDDYLPFVVFAINSTKQASTGVSSFKAMYGVEPILPTLNDITNIKMENHNTKTWINLLITVCLS